MLFSFIVFFVNIDIVKPLGIIRHFIKKKQIGLDTFFLRRIGLLIDRTGNSVRPTCFIPALAYDGGEGGGILAF